MPAIPIERSASGLLRLAVPDSRSESELSASHIHTEISPLRSPEFLSRSVALINIVRFSEKKDF
jgi:hypothetical protein